jgi:FKBP-type peptidyl-prolyl cis-trans isomerase
MEEGVLGTCLNETIRLTIPPHLAFDDGRKQFSRKPVPDKATVVYDITVVDVSSLRDRLENVDLSLRVMACCPCH